MRIALFTCALAVYFVGALDAQQVSSSHVDASPVLERMKNPIWNEREKAFEDAVELVASGKSAPRDADQLRVGLIQLLARENAGGLISPPVDEAEGQDRSEYYARLISTVADMGDARAIPALLGAAGTGGMATRGVARFGKKALDQVLDQVQNPDPDLSSGAVFVVRDMLEYRTASDADSLTRISNALRSALARPEEMIRESAIAAIEYLDGRAEFVPILTEVARSDSSKVDGQVAEDNQDNGEVYPVRRMARLLLTKITNHERPVMDRRLKH